MTLVGGREIHPINVRVGGFYRAPSRRELRTLVEPLERAREAALETVRWTAGFDFPERTVECELVALVAAGRVRDRARPHRLERAASTSRRAEYDEHFEEQHVERSNALHSRLRERRHLPLRPARALHAEPRPALAARARGGAARRASTPSAATRSAASSSAASSSSTPATSRCGSSTTYEEPDAPAVAVEPVAGTGYGVSEAPRGLLYHRYRARRGGHDPRREDRPADLAEPARDRGRPARRRRAQRAARRRRAARASASRRSATTTRASPARPTSSTLEVERAMTARRDRRRQRATAATTASGSPSPSGSAAGPGGVDVVDCEQEPSRLIDAWEGADGALVVDAVASGAAARHACTASTRATEPIPARVLRSSTHAFGLGDAIELARALGRLPGARRRLRRRGRELRAGRAAHAPRGRGSAVGRSRRPSAASEEEPMHERALMDDLMREDRGRRTRGGRRRASPGSRCASARSRTSRRSTSASTSSTPSRGTLAEGAEVDAVVDDEHRRSASAAASCSRASRSTWALMCLGSIAVLAEAWDDGRRRARPARRRLRRLARVRPRRAGPGAHLLLHLGIPVEVLDPDTAREALRASRRRRCDTMSTARPGVGSRVRDRRDQRRLDLGQRPRRQALRRRDRLHDREERGRRRLLLVLALALARSRRSARRSGDARRRDSGSRSLGVGVIGGSVPFVLFFEGLARAEATQASFIQKTLVIWVALLAVPLLRERFGVAARARDRACSSPARPGSSAAPARSSSARARR